MWTMFLLCLWFLFCFFLPFIFGKRKQPTVVSVLSINVCLYRITLNVHVCLCTRCFYWNENWMDLVLKDSVFFLSFFFCCCCCLGRQHTLSIFSIHLMPNRWWWQYMIMPIAINTIHMKITGCLISTI